MKTHLKKHEGEMRNAVDDSTVCKINDIISRSVDDRKYPPSKKHLKNNNVSAVKNASSTSTSASRAQDRQKKMFCCHICDETFSERTFLIEHVQDEHHFCV